MQLLSFTLKNCDCNIFSPTPKIVYKLWPYAGQYVKDLCKETIEPSIAEALKAYKINNFKFEKIILGDTPPRFGGIKVYDDTSRHEIILDTDMV